MKFMSMQFIANVNAIANHSMSTFKLVKFKAPASYTSQFPALCRQVPLIIVITVLNVIPKAVRICLIIIVQFLLSHKSLPP